MLIIHKKAIKNNIVIVALLIASFYLKAEWGFSLRFMSCIVAYISWFYTAERHDFRTKLARELAAKVNLHDLYHKDFIEKDWHSMIEIPTVFVTAGSGLLLSPWLNFHTEFGIADGLCIAFGFYLCCVLERKGSLYQGCDELAEQEAERIRHEIVTRNK